MKNLFQQKSQMLYQCFMTICFHSIDTFFLSFYHKAQLILQWVFFIVVWLLVSFAISLSQQKNILTDMPLRSSTSWSLNTPENWKWFFFFLSWSLFFPEWILNIIKWELQLCKPKYILGKASYGFIQCSGTAELLGVQWAVVSVLEYAFTCIKSHPTVKKMQNCIILHMLKMKATQTV